MDSVFRTITPSNQTSPKVSGWYVPEGGITLAFDTGDNAGRKPLRRVTEIAFAKNGAKNTITLDTLILFTQCGTHALTQQPGRSHNGTLVRRS